MVRESFSLAGDPAFTPTTSARPARRSLLVGGVLAACAALAACSSDSSGTTADAAPAGTTSLSGTLGDLGATKPTVSSVVISNSGETLIYLSSAPLTCATVTQSHWLGMQPAGSQVVELVLPGDPAVGTLQVPPAEVNYAEGGKSSAYEVSANSGSITFTKATASGPVEGTLTGTYDVGNVSGSFHAEFCAGGQGY